MKPPTEHPEGPQPRTKAGRGLLASEGVLALFIGAAAEGEHVLLDAILAIEDEARSKIQDASRLGTELARDIQEKARQDADKIVERAKSEIEHDLAKAKIALREQIVELSTLMTEKVVQTSLDPASHKKLIDRFIEETGQLN